MMSRVARQVTVAIVFFILLVLLGVAVYYLFIKAPETCFDGKQNQDETGSDCGGVCGACQEIIQGEDLSLLETAYVPAGSGKFDVLAKVYNSNDNAGASSFQYRFELKDAQGQVVAERTGQSYILPQETKYLIELNLIASQQPVSATLSISDIVWERFEGYREKPDIRIYQRRYQEISSGVGFSEANGLVSNESPYDFRSILVKIVLRDGSGKPLAVHMTEMRSVSAQQRRDFRLVWPTAFPGTVERVEMEVDADAYHSENFIRQYFRQGKYQELTPPKAY